MSNSSRKIGLKILRFKKNYSHFIISSIRGKIGIHLKAIEAYNGNGFDVNEWSGLNSHVAL